MQPQTQTKTTIFDHYIHVRQEADSYEAMRRELEREVIEEGLKILGDRATSSNSHVVYELNSYRLIIQFRNTTPKTNFELAQLDELIQEEAEKAELENRESLSQLREQLTEIQKKIDELSLTEEGHQLKQEREQLAVQLTTKTPIVVFKPKS